MKLATLFSTALVLFGIWLAGSGPLASTSETRFASYVSAMSVDLRLGTPVSLSSMLR